MTRSERAAAQVRKAQEKRAAEQQRAKERDAALAEKARQAEAAMRLELRKADDKRRYYVGALAQEAGLFAWSDADVRAVFAVLGRLRDTPHPAAVLEGVLCDGPELDGTGFRLTPALALSRSLSPPIPREGEIAPLLS